MRSILGENDTKHSTFESVHTLCIVQQSMHPDDMTLHPATEFQLACVRSMVESLISLPRLAA